ncbi:uncharacterized protein Z518_11276 [Rhinocladiella mackenziei CBS 650.93]|uniref:Rhinocladiella mackenziei CBS 650.93 unplaced genomic scaffold supercont1.12, whole genome shotgun sequence n=1 Tax=Rhinocladiella mackenziei CBS 650.93 TaxID=1442369 RepID=A0A0D2GMG5_9EURO|nr:uncharacterized protein Z518_11276 [Rhinocladiella mackenziei CBS 650.93]KIW99537.1 hypothetical protein Z518_11276 [Rhinocladiella mackenziei CBS 650.93]
MNCPSRTDDAESKHPTWNQNPPFLAADLTTCQDLDGIANSREHKGGSNEAGCLLPVVNTNYLEKPPDVAVPALTRARFSFGLASLRKTVAGGDGRNRLPTPFVTYAPIISSFWSWATWGFSVTVTSLLLSVLGRYREVNLQHIETKELNLDASAPLRKRSTCPRNDISEDLYNTPLHVGALFIILFVSTMACSFPMLATRFPGLRLPGRFFFVVRHFGTGVLIATAFVHLLPTAFVLLGNPCLSGFWTDDYPAMPGAIALAGIFLVTVVEMVFHPSRHIRPMSEVRTSGERPLTTDEIDTPHTRNSRADPTVPLRNMGPLGGRTSSMGRSLSRVNDRSDSDQISRADDPTVKAQPESTVEERGADLSVSALTPEQRHRKAILQCVLLEIGILFHSVFIGMALSVSIGNEFVILLIAITFHQTFEGLALGSRIACITWPKKTLQPWLMALAYGCTTPIGQAIGLATHSLYSPDSETGLLLVGTMNAISAGLLTFASLVELLSEDFLSDDSWKVLLGTNRVCACLLVFFGAFSMSLVGAWA